MKIIVGGKILTAEELFHIAEESGEVVSDNQAVDELSKEIKFEDLDPKAAEEVKENPAFGGAQMRAIMAVKLLHLVKLKKAGRQATAKFLEELFKAQLTPVTIEDLFQVFFGRGNVRNAAGQVVQIGEAMANQVWPGLNAAEIFVINLKNQIYAATFALECYRIQKMLPVFDWVYAFSCESVRACADCFHSATMTNGVQSKGAAAVRNSFAVLTDKSKMLSGKADPKRPETTEISAGSMVQASLFDALSQSLTTASAEINSNVAAIYHEKKAKEMAKVVFQDGSLKNLGAFIYAF